METFGIGSGSGSGFGIDNVMATPRPDPVHQVYWGDGLFVVQSVTEPQWVKSVGNVYAEIHLDFIRFMEQDLSKHIPTHGGFDVQRMTEASMSMLTMQRDMVKHQAQATIVSEVTSSVRRAITQTLEQQP